MAVNKQKMHLLDIFIQTPILLCSNLALLEGRQYKIVQAKWRGGRRIKEASQKEGPMMNDDSNVS